MNRRSNASAPIPQLCGAILIAALLVALGALPLAITAGATINRGHAAMDSNYQDIATAHVPQTSTMTDRHGNPLATFYSQRRTTVASTHISEPMKKAIVAIEDRRFYDHHGVDLRGTARAMLANITHGTVTQGASTLNQQYIKNYLMLVKANTDAERDAAHEDTITRKLREMKLASDLDKNLTKDEILTRYLNLVDFGNGAYGIQEAAHTYFHTNAKDLTIPQAALLAGIVQSTAAYNPFTHPDAATQRRNTVIDAMTSTGALTTTAAHAAKTAPLGIINKPDTPINGCIGADTAGFFCDYALNYLATHGISQKDFISGGYTMTTTLDPHALTTATDALNHYTPPDTPGVTGAMNLIKPDGHEVLAMGASRHYGLDATHHQSVLPLASHPVGNGAGSIFKIFAAAAGLEKGIGIDTVMNVPPRAEVSGMGHGGAPGCPANKYCVENAGTYPPTMTLKQALATSPNTPFIELEKRLGVPTVVDTAVKMGLRSLATKDDKTGTSDADTIKNTNQGSFVLGPIAVDPLELSNVAATIANGGTWCEPNPILKITDHQGKNVPITAPHCERAIPTDVANALANGLADDISTGTARDAANHNQWEGALASKTGTTETNQSAAFLGLTSGLAGAVYIFNDGHTTPLCTNPIRQCADGNLFGGNEPAHIYLSATKPLVDTYGGHTLPPINPTYQGGSHPEALGYTRQAPPTATNPTRGNGGTPTPHLPGPRPGLPNIPGMINDFLHRFIPPRLQGVLP
ncbi:transglycosylase domain-containing protein [Corynebacterium kroppenstedtii]|uniref:transglycosylase domain-containing protein n=1 Tax=Corynebacterium sp. PCR 32 TaxID=3351342 RepID=UPI0030A5679C